LNFAELIYSEVGFCFYTASADQRLIVRSDPVIPLGTAEFDSDDLADARQWGKSTYVVEKLHSEV
jgi:hypothetical protein